MSAPVVVTFARPEESGPFRKKLSGLRKEMIGDLRAWSGKIGAVPVTVVHTGIGPASAERVIRGILERMKPAKVVCAGFGGALDPSFRVGDTLVTDSLDVVLSKEEPIETPADKAAAFRETGARIVDMETATVAAACAAAGVPLIVVRAVSDGADDPLPVPFQYWFDAKRQRPRPVALIGFLLRHPSRVMPFARFVLGLSRIAEALAAAVERAIR